MLGVVGTSSPIPEQAQLSPNGRLPPLDLKSTLPKPMSILKPAKPVLKRQISNISMGSSSHRGKAIADAASKKVSYVEPGELETQMGDQEGKVMTFAEVAKEINDFIAEIETDLNQFGYLAMLDWVGGRKAWIYARLFICMKNCMQIIM